VWDVERVTECIVVSATEWVVEENDELPDVRETPLDVACPVKRLVAWDVVSASDCVSATDRLALREWLTDDEEPETEPYETPLETVGPIGVASLTVGSIACE
jgi:hypothetical protein